jgi:mannose-6-phosphate isomerase-like protein (cupin superfamily)
MRHIAGSVLILSLACDVATAQQFTKADTGRPPVVPALSRAAARRVAEKQRRAVDVVDARLLASQSEFLARYRGIGTTLHTSNDEQTLYILVRRTATSRPEVHARWDDLVIVRSGTGAIEMGDSLVGSTYRAPGERRGGKFTRSSQVVVRAGDIVRIPAAVPHAFIVSGTEALEYLLIKQRRQELPIRWFGDP